MSETSEGPGQVLRAEREALGVTTRDVAETLNLAVSMVEAIEADDYEQMPAAVFARGYIRAYARLLSLEPEPLVARYPEDAGVADGNGASGPSAVELLRQNSRLVAGAGGLVLLVLLGVWLWPESKPAAEFGSGSPAEAPVSATEAATEAVDDSVDDSVDDPAAASAAGGAADLDEGNQPIDAPSSPSQDPASRGPVSGTQATVDGDEPSAISASEPASDVEMMADPQDDVPAPPTSPVPATRTEDPTPSREPEPDSVVAPRADPPGARRITEFGSDRLSFEFSEDCWVEVKSATGRRLYSNLSVAGRTLSLVGQGPFRILLGYAPGARMSFNGEPVSLAPHTRNNVATLVVGQ